MGDGGDRAGDLAGHKGLAAPRAFMVEENAVGGVKAIGLPVIHGDPVGVELGGRVGAAWPERRGLPLGGLQCLAVKFRRRGLVEARASAQSQDANRLQQSKRPQPVRVGRVFGGLEAHLHMALRREIVDFVRLGFLDDANDVGRVRHVPIVEEEARRGLVRVDVKMIDPLRVEGRSSALNAMNDIIFFEQEFGKVTAVLAGDAGNQRGFACGTSRRIASRNQYRPHKNGSLRQVLNKFNTSCQRGL